MQKQNKRFVLATATLDEVNKQLKLNAFVAVIVVFILAMNILNFMNDKSFFYGVLIAVMLCALYFIVKSRHILNLKKQDLIDINHKAN